MKSLKEAGQIIAQGVQPVSMLNLGRILNLSRPISLKAICNACNVDLTLVWIGDVHLENYMVKGVGQPTAWNPQTQWIVDNRATYNIQAVLCAGDIQSFVDTGETPTNNLGTQLALAWENNCGNGNGLKLIDDLGLPYLVTAGNHDYSSVTGVAGRDTSTFDTQLGNARIKSKKWYTGCWDNPNPIQGENTLATQAIHFQVANRKFLVIAIECFPRNLALKWAKEKSEQYSDHEVIIITHAFMDHTDGSLLTDPGTVSGTACYNLDNNPGCNQTDQTCMNDGICIWNWAQQFRNLKAIMCGHSCDALNAIEDPGTHESGPTEAFNPLTATDGHMVLGIYSDHQSDYMPNTPNHKPVPIPNQVEINPSYDQVVLLLELLSNKSNVVIRAFNTTTGQEITNSYYYQYNSKESNFQLVTSNVFPYVLPW
jgi:hypothetical protein